MLRTYVPIILYSTDTSTWNFLFLTDQWFVSYVQLLYLNLVCCFQAETSETHHAMCNCENKMRMFLVLWHWSVPNKFLQYKQTYYHHSIQIKFGVQIWLLHVLHNHYGTTHLENLNSAWMSLGACWHSDVFQYCVHVVGEIQVYELWECLCLDKIPQLTTPSWQDIFCYIFFSKNWFCRSLTQLTLFIFLERAYTMNSTKWYVLIYIKLYVGSSIWIVLIWFWTWKIHL